MDGEFESFCAGVILTVIVAIGPHSDTITSFPGNLLRKEF